MGVIHRYLYIGLSRRESFLVLKAAHPQRDGRSNEQITQQAERSTPPTTVCIDWAVLDLPRVEVCYEHRPLGLDACLDGAASAHRLSFVSSQKPGLRERGR